MVACGVMVIDKPDRRVPDWLVSKNQRLELAGLAALYENNFTHAEKRFNEQYELLLSSQTEAKRPIHKGAPLHNLGLSLYGQGRIEEAIRSFLLAYVEDSLDCAHGSENESDTKPAAAVLRDLLRANPVVLEEVKKVSREEKETGRWDRVFDPDALLSRVFKALKLSGRDLKSQTRRKTNLIDPASVIHLDEVDRRVFIGSDYDQHSAAIAVIRTVVDRRGYIPVVAYELDLPKKRTHYYSLLLLHSCRYAIFDITSYAGQMMELERCIDYEARVLCVRNSLTKRLGKRISAMIRTMKLYPKPVIRVYKDDPELERVVDEWLP
jgi:hypothetical protein